MEFDYVIVGGGSSGATLAGRLSADPSVSVCLLEAGGDGKDLLIRAPTGAIVMVPDHIRYNNWGYETVPQPGLNGRRGYAPRGKTLGGSSAINAMLYVRGHRKDYDEWAGLGCDGWAWDDVLPYFRRAENNERGEDGLHGASGPLHVSNQKSPRPITAAFIQAANERQIRSNADFNGAEQEGVGYYQCTQFHGARNGERCTSAAAYLHPHLARPNLTVLTRAQATQILFSGKRATGVAYRRGGTTQSVMARREVILSGGAYNTPQLLLLSGVGPAAELSALGVPVVHDLPGVGKNLQDHLDFILAWKSDNHDMVGIGLRGMAALIRHMWRWRKTGDGMIATTLAEAGAFLKSDPALERPDLQLHFVIALVDDHARKLHMGYGYSCHVCVLRPHSVGEVRLSSRDPLAPPAIDPRYLSDERDLDLLVKGAKLTREIMTGPALAPYRAKELYTKPGMSDDDWKAHVRARADTIYHPVGTAKMGKDAMAVVDPQLRVHGIEGLRVVDVSIMPRLIGGNTNAPAIMIGEKAADLIKAARG